MITMISTITPQHYLLMVTWGIGHVHCMKIIFTTNPAFGRLSSFNVPKWEFHRFWHVLFQFLHQSNFHLHYWFKTSMELSDLTYNAIFLTGRIDQFNTVRIRIRWSRLSGRWCRSLKRSPLALVAWLSQNTFPTYDSKAYWLRRIKQLVRTLLQNCD